MAPVKRPMIERLFERVEKIEGGCWNWLGHTTNGYGSINDGNGRQIRTHRASYEHHKGPIPEGLVLDHLCRNRICVNPDHLEAVTERENILRGESPSARNAVKTHCVNGHPFDDENTGYQPGGRMCRACAKDRSRKRHQRAARTYRSWSIECDFDTPLAECWQATHPDYEDPAYEDGRPLVLREVDERELQIAIDDYLFELDAAAVAAIGEAADALKALLEKHGLASISVGLQRAAHGDFYFANGLGGGFRHGTGDNLGEAVEKMLREQPARQAA